MSDTCVTRSVKVFIPTLKETGTDLSEGRLCKEQVLPSDMTDHTAMLLIPNRHQLKGLAAVSTISLVCLHLNYNIEPFNPSCSHIPKSNPPLSQLHRCGLFLARLHTI